MDAEHHQVATNGRMLRRQLEKICEDAVQRKISALFAYEPTDIREEALRSHGGQYGNLLRRMSQAALEYALANNIGPDDFEDEVLRDALALVERLRYAFINDPRNLSLNFLDDCPIDLIEADKVPRIDRPSLESLVGDYLALPYRSQAMDRALVRCLIAAELYAFGDEMRGWWWPTLFRFSSGRKVRNLLAIMDTLYYEQRSDGPISAYYTRERANDARKQGVIWPAPLFAVLDDIISRTGRY
jgi:hypothetical protein